MYSAADLRTLLLRGCPIRKSADLRLLPPSRGVSPVVASFFAFSYQGIHRTPLVTQPTHVLCVDTVSYTHLTLPTILLVQISVVAVSLKKKKKINKTNNTSSQVE
eukprot:TRINITY_DN5232_c0_g1_i3.p4 TRINITY_DN5232_c0_g1~~TRINITY_DN5232_c0_g1_i3.p4  ORF type:complete len:105 (+),score=9.44 TRINITY_DN5232_c0_g1_i3:837-1151(+)